MSGGTFRATSSSSSPSATELARHSLTDLQQPRVKRRVVVYCDSPIAGGFEQIVGRFANTLAAAGEHEIELWYWLDRLGDLASHPNLAKRRLPFATGVPLPFARAFDPRAIWRLVQMLRARRADVIVVCQGSIEIGARALIAARLAGTPAVSYLAYAFDLRTVGARVASLREFVDRLFYRLPLAFIAVNEFQCELVRRRVSVPVYTIPSAIAARDVDALARPPAAETPRLEIGIVGSVSFATKGHDILLPLLGALRSRGTLARLHVVGDGPDLGALRTQVAVSGRENDFVFYGDLPYGAPQKIMGKLDLLVIPSRFEGTLPLVAFEALAAGTPFVISDLPSIQEFDVPSALRFDRDSLSDVLRAIDEAIRYHASPECEPFRRRLLAAVTSDAFDRAATQVLREIVSAHA